MSPRLSTKITYVQKEATDPSPLKYALEPMPEKLVDMLNSKTYDMVATRGSIGGYGLYSSNRCSNDDESDNKTTLFRVYHDDGVYSSATGSGETLYYEIDDGDSADTDTDGAINHAVVLTLLYGGVIVSVFALIIYNSRYRQKQSHGAAGAIRILRN